MPLATGGNLCRPHFLFLLEGFLMIPLIPSRVHAVLDYLMAAVLILVPLLWIDEVPAAAWVPIILGAGTLVYSLITRYELSAAKLIPLPVHLVIDALAGLLLLASPWLFGFADQIWVPHVVLGLIEIGAAAFTKPRADRALDRGPDGSIDRRSAAGTHGPGRNEGRLATEGHH